MSDKLKKYLEEESNKQKLLDLLESRGSDLSFKKEELHGLIHDDLPFFFNLVRVYCNKNAQVGRLLDILELLNLIGEVLCHETENKLEVKTEGVSFEDIENHQKSLINHIEGLPVSKSDNGFDTGFLKPKTYPKKEVEDKEPIIKLEKVNLKAKYIISSVLNEDKKQESILYTLGAYTEQKLLKELPTYFPIGSLDYHDLIMARLDSEVNALIMSPDIKDKALALKHLETSHLNDKYEEAVLQRNIRAKEVALKAIHNDLNHIQSVSNHYALFGGLNYLEQKEDQAESQKKKVSNIKNPIEKKLATIMVDEMSKLYNKQHASVTKKEE